MLFRSITYASRSVRCLLILLRVDVFVGEEDLQAIKPKLHRRSAIALHNCLLTAEPYTQIVAAASLAISGWSSDGWGPSMCGAPA